MGYDERGRGGSSFAVLAAVVIVVLVVGVLILFGVGALLFVRTSMVRSEAALREQRQAVVEATRRQQEIEQRIRDAQVREEARDGAAEPQQRDVALNLDRDGVLRSNLQELTLEQLRDQLGQLQPAGTLRVRLRVHPDCRFERVRQVQQLCETLGIQDLQLETAAAGVE